MPSMLDYDLLERRLLARLATVGSATAKELRLQLGISQPAFSRLAARAQQHLLVVGKGRATRYAARRAIGRTGSILPLYLVGEAGGTRHVANLHGVLAEGFWVESLDADLQSKFYTDLPYFLHELRPQGFLGRQVPRRHAELSLPADIQLWSADDSLSYLTRHGWDTVGNWIVGEVALREYLEHLDYPANLVHLEQRAQRYRALSEDALADAPGSSAGGEQPKFVATLIAHHAGKEVRSPVLVKFSPPLTDRIGQRLGDLLVAEHLAHETLRAQGIEAARSELLLANDAVYLQVERFDRTPMGGRRGLVSLLALDSEFVGSLQAWPISADELERLGVIDVEARRAIRFAHCFGRLIANTDMHFGNLSLWIRGERVLGVAPLYDMLPMLYASSTGHVKEPAFTPAPVNAREAEVWRSASLAALEFWRTCSADDRISPEFRATCSDNVAVIQRWQEVAQRAPWGER